MKTDILRTAPEGNVKVTVRRDPGFMGSGLKSVVTINGEAYAKIKPGQILLLSLPEGEIFLGVVSAEGANLGNEFIRELVVDLDVSKEYFFRVFPMPTQGIVIERTSG